MKWRTAVSRPHEMALRRAAATAFARPAARPLSLGAASACAPGLGAGLPRAPLLLSGGGGDRRFSIAAATTVAADLHGDSVATSVASCPTQARHLFEAVWEDLTNSRPLSEIIFPREVVWLTGAPGAGKGTFGEVIKRERDIVGAFEVSSLLSTPAFKARKEAGQLIGDKDVVQAVVLELLRPEYRGGCIVDGYPRTETQAHCIRLLRDKIDELWVEHRSHPELRKVLRRANFSITCFYCSEEESVRRQIHRGEELMRLNKMIADTGVGHLQSARATDLSPEAARTRYRIFRDEVYGSLQAVKEQMAFHFINADGPPDEVRKQLLREFKYQSSFDLGDDVHGIVRAVPSAKTAIRQARSNLVARLSGYAIESRDLFEQVVAMIGRDFVHIISRQSLAGAAVVRSQNPLLEQVGVLGMVLDVLSERGYSVVLDVVRESVPLRVDLATGRIETRSDKVFVFRIEFPRPEIRRNEG